MLVFLLLSVVVALVGGLGPAVVSAVAGAMLLNWFFTPPLHTLGVTDPNNAVTLVVFVTGGGPGQLGRRPGGPAYARGGAGCGGSRGSGPGRPHPYGAARGRGPRPAHAARRGQGGRLDAAQRRPRPRRRPTGTSCWRPRTSRSTSSPRLIENLLDMSRLQAGAMAVVLRPVALEEVVPGRSTTSAPRGALLLDLPAVPDVEADPGLLERVLANLVANALRYSPPGMPRCCQRRPPASASRSASSTTGRASPPTSASRCSCRSSASVTPTTPPGSASASPCPAGSPRRWAARSPPRTPRAAG